MPAESLPADRQPVLIAAKRTPIGRFLGGFSRTPATALGAHAIDAVLADAPAARDHVDEVIMGCVLQAGVGQAPARQAALGAGLPDTINAQTVNKVCGSGLQSVMLAAQSIKAGDNQLVVAGGMENMTMAPHFANVRQGAKFGDVSLRDHMQYDGLRCAFEACAMGDSADWIASEHSVSREDQDAWAVRSHHRAAEATEQCFFSSEIAPLTGKQVGNRKAPGPEGGVAKDEGIRADSSIEGLAKLRPAFSAEGTVTAGNASQISDGAAAVIVASKAKAEELGLAPVATIHAYSTSGVRPREIFRAPSLSIPAAVEKAGLTLADIDLIELNEAFAAQTLQNIREAKLDEDKVNVCGGGIALGHPIGASGARVLTTLVYQMTRLEKRLGVAALCLGGGNSVAMVIER
ncbi:MAG: thiolase family protein [Planctomycetota bacterium]